MLSETWNDSSIRAILTQFPGLVEEAPLLVARRAPSLLIHNAYGCQCCRRLAYNMASSSSSQPRAAESAGRRSDEGTDVGILTWAYPRRQMPAESAGWELSAEEPRIHPSIQPRPGPPDRDGIKSSRASDPDVQTAFSPLRLQQQQQQQQRLGETLPPLLPLCLRLTPLSLYFCLFLTRSHASTSLLALCVSAVAQPLPRGRWTCVHGGGWGLLGQAARRGHPALSAAFTQLILNQTHHLKSSSMLEMFLLCRDGRVEQQIRDAQRYCAGLDRFCFCFMVGGGGVGGYL